MSLGHGNKPTRSISKKEEDQNQKNDANSLQLVIPSSTTISTRLVNLVTPDPEMNQISTNSTFQPIVTQANGNICPIRIDGSPEDIPEVVNCTACNNQLLLKKRKIFKHPRLNVLLCKSCLKFINSNDFTKDEMGIEEYCTWCGDGGNLVCCDFCEKAYCKYCIKRNLGKDFLRELLNAPDDEKWKCLCCDSNQINIFISECSIIMKYLSDLKLKESSVDVKKTHISELNKKDRTNKLNKTVASSGNSDVLMKSSFIIDNGKDNIQTSDDMPSNDITDKTLIKREKKQKVIVLSSEEESGDEIVVISKSGKKTVLNKSLLMAAQLLLQQKESRGAAKNQKKLSHKRKNDSSSESENSESSSDVVVRTLNSSKKKSSKNARKTTEPRKKEPEIINGIVFDDEQPGPSGLRPKNKMQKLREKKKQHSYSSDEEFIPNIEALHDHRKEENKKIISQLNSPELDEAETDTMKSSKTKKSKVTPTLGSSTNAGKTGKEQEEIDDSKMGKNEDVVNKENSESNEIVNIPDNSREKQTCSNEYNSTPDTSDVNSNSNHEKEAVDKTSNVPNVEILPCIVTLDNIIEKNIHHNISEKECEHEGTRKEFCNDKSTTDQTNEGQPKNGKKRKIDHDDKIIGDKNAVKNSEYKRKKHKQHENDDKESDSEKELMSEIEENNENVTECLHENENINNLEESEQPKSDNDENTETSERKTRERDNKSNDDNIEENNNQRSKKFEDASHSDSDEVSKERKQKTPKRLTRSIKTMSTSENEKYDDSEIPNKSPRRKTRRITVDPSSENSDMNKLENDESSEEISSNESQKVRRTKAKDRKSEEVSSDECQEVKKSKAKNINQVDETSCDESQIRRPKRKFKMKKKSIEVTTDDSDNQVKRRSNINNKRRKQRKTRLASNTDDDFEGNSSEESSEDEDEINCTPDTNSSSDSTSDGSIIIRKRGKQKKNKNGKKSLKRGKKNNVDEEEESDDDNTKSPTKGRKKIRKILKDSQLTEETKRARELEEQRRKRLLELTKAERLENKKVLEVADGEFVLEKNKEKEPLVSVSADINIHLKPHQRKGIKFMYECTIESVSSFQKGEPGSGCLLAHCMGLGKTLQVVSFVYTCYKSKKINMEKFLVVAPLNTVLNWEHEFEKWLSFDECIDVYVLSHCTNGNKERLSMIRHWYKNGGVLITGYEMYRNLVNFSYIKSKKMKEDIKLCLVDPGPQLVICDEGHVLRNSTSGISIAMNSIATKRRIVLTGTPLQNNLPEYHVMVDFVKPKLLGTKKEFQNRFVNPINNGRCSNSTPRDVKIMKQRCHVLYQLLSGCVQRQDYSVLTPFLPMKREYTIFVRLTEKQIKIYNHYLENFVYKNSLDELKGSCLFSDFHCLSRISTHPWSLHLERLRQIARNPYKDVDDFVIDDEEEDETSEESSDEEKKPWNEDTSSDDESDKKRRNRRGRAISLDSEKSDSSKESDDIVVEKEVSSRAARASRRTTRAAAKSKIFDIEESRRKNDNINADDCDVTQSNIAGSQRSGLSFRDASLNPECKEEEPEYKKEWYDEFLTEEDEKNVELSGKLVLMLEIIANAELVGDKVLVFTQSLASLDLIESTLGGGSIGGNQLNWYHGIDYFRMDGSTTIQKRKRWSDIFNDPDNDRCRLFLISTRAGSLGINMVAANRVIIFDCSWNPSHDVQSVFRVYRFGQEKPVYVYRLVAQGTIEEKIYGRQITKLAVASRVVDEKQIERHFTDEEIRELYVFEPDKNENSETPQLPKDPLLAEVLQRQHPRYIVRYHEHDLLLENVADEEMTEEEKKAAWKSYEEEKEMAAGKLQYRVNAPNFNEFLLSYQQQQLQQQRPALNMSTINSRPINVPRVLPRPLISPNIPTASILRNMPINRVVLTNSNRNQQYSTIEYNPNRSINNTGRSFIQVPSVSTVMQTRQPNSASQFAGYRTGYRTSYQQIASGIDSGRGLITTVIPTTTSNIRQIRPPTFPR